MPDREISPPGLTPEVRIPVHPQSGRRQEVVLRLSPQATPNYGVWQKDMPEGMPTSLEGRQIDWFNNFGLKRRGSDEYEASVPPFTITVDRGPEGADLVAYDEAQGLWKLETANVNGRVQATLDRGDPAVGWAG